MEIKSHVIKKEWKITWSILRSVSNMMKDVFKSSTHHDLIQTEEVCKRKHVTNWRSQPKPYQTGVSYVLFRECNITSIICCLQKNNSSICWSDGLRYRGKAVDGLVLQQQAAAHASCVPPLLLEYITDLFTCTYMMFSCAGSLSLLIC